MFGFSCFLTTCARASAHSKAIFPYTRPILATNFVGDMNILHLQQNKELCVSADNHILLNILLRSFFHYPLDHRTRTESDHFPLICITMTNTKSAFLVDTRILASGISLICLGIIFHRHHSSEKTKELPCENKNIINSFPNLGVCWRTPLQKRGVFGGMWGTDFKLMWRVACFWGRQYLYKWGKAWRKWFQYHWREACFGGF